jgi:transposase-like protein
VSTPIKKYKRKFKLDAVRLVIDGDYSVEQVAQKIDVDEDRLRQWVHELAVEPGRPAKKLIRTEAQQLADAIREIEKLRSNNRLLASLLALTMVNEIDKSEGEL